MPCAGFLCICGGGSPGLGRRDARDRAGLSLLACISIHTQCVSIYIGCIFNLGRMYFRLRPVPDSVPARASLPASGLRFRFLGAKARFPGCGGGYTGGIAKK